jgi:three-Cys-motif partner protein
VKNNTVCRSGPKATVLSAFVITACKHKNTIPEPTMTSATSLVPGDDGLPAEEVGAWILDKHNYLRRYVDISRGARKKFLGARKAGATFIDLFSGTGRARIRETGQWIDGSAVAAWRMAQEGGAAFSEVLIADIDEERRRACAERLRRLAAPVRELAGSAIEAAKEAVATVNPHGLHFAFLDPYNLGELDFSIIQTLSKLKRIDMLIHVSAMDLQRNLGRNVAAVAGVFDTFAPGWRNAVNINASQQEIRRQVFEYWRDQVFALGTGTANDVRLITGENNQRLYWLLLAAKHELARKFWNLAANVEKQGNLF